MGWRFHRVLNVIPGLVRLNVGKSGVSTSVGPRGADVNIGPHGISTNTGLPGTGLSYRQKLGYHGSGIGVGLLVAALAFAGWRHFDAPKAAPLFPSSAPATQTASSDVDDGYDDDAGGIPTITREAHKPHARSTHDERAQAGADVIAAAKPASGTMYVHRNNSDLRPAPSTSSEAIKKLAKGEQVTLLALSDKWAEVEDGSTKGWVRASILKDTPPGEKSAKRKKKSDS